jgi:hypothetical protein
MLVRVGYGALAALNLWWGAWARVAPHGFYVSFPGFGHHWVAAYPPYNEHLVTDLGAISLTLGVLLAIATVVSDRRVRWTVLTGVLVFNFLHLTFHAMSQGAMAGLDYEASLGTLILGVVGPLVLAGLEIVLSRQSTVDVH